MRLRQAEAEATGVLSDPSVSGSVASGYVPAAHDLPDTVTTLTAHQTVRAATSGAKGGRFNAVEALFVALWMSGMTYGAYLVRQSIMAVAAGMLFPFPVGSGTVRSVVSSAVLVLEVAIFGFVVGMLANRRTMAVSIVAANIAGLVAWVFIALYLYLTLPREAWAASTIPTFGVLFQAVTLTVTEVGIAYFVARTFRKREGNSYVDGLTLRTASQAETGR